MPVTRNALQASPKPPIVAIGFEQGGLMTNVLEAMGGTVRCGEDLSMVRLSDYDFVVTCHSLGNNLPSHVNGIHFLPQEGGIAPVRESQQLPGSVGVRRGSRAADFAVDSAAEARGVTALLRETVMASIPVESEYDVLTYSATDWTGKFEPVVSERGGCPLAALAISPTGQEWWYLPEFTDKKERAVEALFARWQLEQPESFDAAALDSGAWKTSAEVEADEAIAEYESATLKLLQERQVGLAQLKTTADEVALEAKMHEKRLLISKGHDLEEAVADALTTLGFDVVNSDERQESKGAAKREDLEVKVSGEFAWVALAEGKGYEPRSAKTYDIGQLQKAAGFYERDQNKVPDSLWYIANANHGKPPEVRPIPLESSPDDVEVFAEDGGAVIDTRELFLMVRAVQAGTLSKSDAVATLVSARGIFSSHFGKDASVE